MFLRPLRVESRFAMDKRRVGVLGGGQLGRMMAEAGHRLGIQLAILDPCKWFIAGETG